MNRKFTTHHVTALLCAMVLTFTTQAQSVMPPANDIFPSETELNTASPMQVLVANAPASAASLEAYTVASGEWNHPSVWDCGCVPDANYDVTILNGDSVSVTSNISVMNLTINADAHLEISSAVSVEVYVSGDWTNQGSFDAGTSLVNLDGVALQQVIGESDFYDLNVANAEEVVLMGPTGVTSLLFLNTTLTTNTNLVLKSSGIGASGSLAPVMGGTLNGLLGLEHTVQAPYQGWLTIGAPFVNATLEQWNDDFITTGFDGSDFPAYEFVSVRTYDESAAPDEDSFLPVSSADEMISNGLGYYVYANAGTYTFDVFGQPMIGNTTMPVTFTDTGNPTSDGFNVVANPFPSNINWDDEDWTKNNMYNAIYVWDVGLNQFRTYVNGYGVNGGTPLIRSGEAFWVQANAPSPELGVSETVKVSSDWTPEVNVGDQFLKLRLDGLGLGDEVIIAFDENATQDFDQSIDAFKFVSSNAVLSMATVSTDDMNLAINNLPLDQAAFDVPVLITSQEAGEIQLTVENFPNITDRCMFMEDMITGELYDLEPGMLIVVETEVVTEQERFMIHMGEALQVEASPIVCFGDNNASIEVTGIGIGPWTYTWTDGEGTEILVEEDVNGSSSLDDLTEGTYHVSVLGNPVCDALSRTFEIIEPVAIELSSSHADIGCDEVNTGAVTVEFSGGAEPLMGQWLNGETSTSLTDLEAGTYVFTITDANGCEVEEVVVIDQAPTVVADFEPSAQIVNLSDGLATINFTNLSENGEIFVWDFGDGGMPSMDANPSHSYTETGSYIVSLDASNDQCDDSHQIVVIVQDAVGTEDIPMDQTVDVFLQGGMPVIRFRHDDKREYSIQAHNLLGQQLIAPITGSFGGETLPLELLHMVPATMITLNNTVTGESHTFKILR